MKNDLFGLILCGGKSSRMGQDKSLLTYHDLPQRYYLYNFAAEICTRVFLSCNATQTLNTDKRYNVITDNPQYENTGPFGALLTAWEYYPDASFLVIGCDYPLLTKEDVLKLYNSRDEAIDAVCLYNSATGFDEPLIAVYEASCLARLMDNFKKGKHSLRHLLSEVNTKRIAPVSDKSITGIDTPGQYKTLKQLPD